MIVGSTPTGIVEVLSFATVFADSSFTAAEAYSFIVIESDHDFVAAFNSSAVSGVSFNALNNNTIVNNKCCSEHRVDYVVSKLEVTFGESDGVSVALCCTGYRLDEL